MRNEHNTERVATVKRYNTNPHASRQDAAPLAKVERLCSSFSRTVHYASFPDPIS